MVFLIRVLLFVVAIGLLWRLGLGDMLATQLREVALVFGANPETFEVSSLLSLSGIYAAIGALPQPFSALGKLVLTLLLIGLVMSALVALGNRLIRIRRWLNDLFT